MPLRLGIHLAGPIYWTPRSRAEKAARRDAEPSVPVRTVWMEPEEYAWERQEEASFEAGFFGALWTLWSLFWLVGWAWGGYVIAALVSAALLFGGDYALWLYARSTRREAERVQARVDALHPQPMTQAERLAALERGGQGFIAPWAP